MLVCYGATKHAGARGGSGAQRRGCTANLGGARMRECTGVLGSPSTIVGAWQWSLGLGDVRAEGQTWQLRCGAWALH